MLGVQLGTRLTVMERHAFDGSLHIKFAETEEVQMLAPSVAERLWVDQSNPSPIIVFPETEDA